MDAQHSGEIQPSYEERLASFRFDLQRAIAPVLKRLYPQNPDLVLGREAGVIAEAISPVVQGIHDPLGRDHMEDAARLAEENDRFREALEHIAKEPAPGSTIYCRNTAKVALSGREQADR